MKTNRKAMNFPLATPTLRPRIERKIALALTPLLLGPLALAPIALGASGTWTGSGTTGNWSDTANWSGGTVPGSTSGTANTDIATINATSTGWGRTADNPIIVDSASQNIKYVTFVGQATGSEIFLGNANGNALQLTSGGKMAVNNSGARLALAVTVNVPLVQYGNYFYENTALSGAGEGSGVVNLAGNISGGAEGSYSVAVQGSNTNANTISGVISNGLSSALSVKKYGAGTWRVTGLNTFTGTAVIADGTLEINSIANTGMAQSLGMGTERIFLGGNGTVGTLQFTGTSGGSSNRNFFINNGSQGGGGVIENAVAGQMLALSGTIKTAAAGSSSTLVLGGEGDGIFDGIIEGSPTLSLTKSGSGTWTVSGNNTHGGTTTVVAGTLLVSNTAGSATGTGSVLVGSGGRLGGTGTLRPGSGNSIFVTGIVTPGNASEIGELTFDGGAATSALATFAAGASFEFDLDGQTVSSDRLNLVNGAAGDFAFSGNNIAFSVLNSLASGQTYTLFSSDASSAFSGLTYDGNHVIGGLSFSGLGTEFQADSYISLSGNNLVLNVVPEPGSWVLLAVAGMLFIVLRARRKTV